MDAQDLKGYELRERIGRGGFGAVYRAYQTTVGREVAIKIILPGLASQPDFIRRFEGEAQLVARLEHPHIVPLHDYWRDPEGAYLVMRWLRGGSLREALHSGPFELRAAASLLDQVAGALSLAHRNSVIHRDIKPGNILLDEDGNAYLTDFGIAKDLNLAGSGTQPDAIIGSLDYISPEQARSEPVTARTDIYSLGVTMYEVITGHHPFENISSVERLYKHINDPLPEITTVEPSVADAVNKVIQKATAKNPEHRYPDALAFAADFREAVGLNRTPTTVLELLTQREHEILRLIIEGMSNKEIAQHLTVTLGTVKWYVNQIYSKLGVRSRVQAIVRARELNLIGGTLDDSAAHGAFTTSNLPEPENPYKGLRAFQAADEQDFFGRDELTQKLIHRMKGIVGAQGLAPLQVDNDHNHRFLAVVGPSGSGKSSVVKAGLIPALWRGELPGSERWFIAEMLPGAHPLDKLEVALIRVAANQASNLNEHLIRDQRGLLRVADLILPNDSSDLVLVIDQFEEVFTLVENEAERQQFLTLLATAVTDPRSRVRVVLTLRADFYDRPLNYPEFGDLVRHHMETVMPLSAKELERAISGPAQRSGVRFEEGLVASIVAEMNYQAGALPLLQYALTELFERREGRLLTHQAYQEIGGAVGALAKRAEELYQELTPEGQEAARQMFLRLVTLGEGVEDTRRRTPRAELLAIADGVGAQGLAPLQTHDNDLMDEILDTYASYRLLTLDNDLATRTPTVELAHEAILREWERLRGWLNESRHEIRLQRQLAAMAAEWRDAHREPSFLARGARLEQFEKWTKDTELALTAEERRYLEASLAERERQVEAEQKRQARETTLEHRSRSFLRLLVVVFATATLVAIGLSLFAFDREGQAQEAQATSLHNAQIAQTNADYARSIALAAAARSLQLSNNPDQAIALALAANTTTDSVPAFAQSVLYETSFVPATQRLLTGQSADDVVVSPDGHRALSWNQEDSGLVYWELETGQILSQIPELTEGDIIGEVHFAPDGETAYAHIFPSDLTSSDIIEFDVTTGEEIRRFERPETVFLGSPMVLSPDGQTILAVTYGVLEDGGLYQGPLYTLDVSTGSIVRQFAETPPDLPYWIYSLAFSPDGQQALVGYDTRSVIIWDVTTGQPIRTLENFIDEARGNYFTTEGIITVTTQFAGDNTTTVMLWDGNTGAILRQQTWPGGILNTVALSPDGATLALGFSSPYIVLFDLQTWHATAELYGHGLGILSLMFTPNGQYLLSTSFDGDIRLWNMENGAEIMRLSGLSNFVSGVVLSPDGRTALAQSYNGPMTLWDIESGDRISHLTETHNSVNGIAFSHDGRYFVSGTSADSFSCPNPDGELILTEAASGQIIWRVKTDGHMTWGKAFINGDSQIVTVDANCGNNIIVWDTATGQQVAEWIGHQAPSQALGVSPDGKFVATGSQDATAILWDAATGSIVHTLPHGSEVLGLAFSPDNRQLMTADVDGILHLWDIVSGQELQQLRGHSSAVLFMQFSPDGQYLASSGRDSSIFVWNLQTGEVVRQFRSPEVNRFGSPVAFSPDGQSLFINDEADAVHQYDLMLQPGELLDWVYANRYIPELTCDQRALYRLEPLCEAT